MGIKGLRPVYFLALLLMYVFAFVLFHSKINEKSDCADSCTEEKIFSKDSKCSAESETILNFIRERHLFPPSRLEYNITEPVHPIDSTVQFALETQLTSKVPGFFIECGANNGEFISQTIDLEKNHGWTGLLIEASPSLFKVLKSKQRKAWLSDICLSSGKPEKIEFMKHKDDFPVWRIGNGRVNPDKYYKEPLIVKEGFERENYFSEGNVECFSLYSLLKSMNQRTVDFFSLDVEGHELTILKAIPFHKLEIKTILVEHLMHTETDKQQILDLLLRNGYQLFKETDTDFIFVL